MPFGVELPDNLGEEKEAEVKDTENTEKDLGEQKSTEEIKELVDLDKLEKFRFDGRDWSPKDLKSAYLMQSDYTKKTQEVAKDRQYVDNFRHDLNTLIADPKRIEEFAKVYPKHYTDIAKSILETLTTRGQKEEAPNQGAGVDPKFLSEFNSIKGKISEWEEAQRQAEIEKIHSWIDNQFDSLSKKYPFANAEAVNARASYLADTGTQITEQVLDKLFKSNNDEIKQAMDKVYKEKAVKQIEANKKGKDIGVGGGVPSQAPKGFKTIKEATAALLDDIDTK